MSVLSHASFVSVCLSIVLGGVLLLFQPHWASAGLFGDSETNDALEGAMKDVESLLQITQRPELPFHNTRARKLLDFVSLEKEKPATIKLADLEGAEGAYWEFRIKRPLSEVAKYLFTPAVPAHAVYLGSVRMGGWEQPEVAAAGLKPLHGQLPDMENPIVVRGTEFEATAPDPNSGTYFRYDLNRLVVGYNNKQTPLIISVSQMQGESTVGKKGVAFGPPEDWYYFYSGIKGNLLSGVGWAESKMYSSTSVVVMRQVSPQVTHVAILKWVKAGWKGMNMVKRKHILGGLKSYGKELRWMMNLPTLPAPETIAAESNKIASMSAETMREKLAPLQKLLTASAQSNDVLQRDEFKPLVQGDYLQSLTREELAAELVKDYMRGALSQKAITAPQ